MAFQLSPGVNVSEVDLTTVVPAVGTTTGALVGTFAWGPANQTPSEASVEPAGRGFVCLCSRRPHTFPPPYPS